MEHHHSIFMGKLAISTGPCSVTIFVITINYNVIYDDKLVIYYGLVAHSTSYKWHEPTTYPGTHFAPVSTERRMAVGPLISRNSLRFLSASNLSGKPLENGESQGQCCDLTNRNVDFMTNYG